MTNRSWAISRRTCLRGVGVAIALPLLDIMTPAWADEAAVATPKFKPPAKPVRLFMLNMPCGTYYKEWGLTQVEGKPTFKPMLAALQPYQSDITLVQNLMNKAATAHPIGHYANEGNLWTSTVMKKTGGADLDVGGVSVDQLAARCTAAVTRFPSLNLGMESPYGGTDAGWARVYNNQLSWSSPTTPVPNEIDPKRAFNRLFRQPAARPAAGGAVAMALSQTEQQSVLDYVLGEAQSLRRTASIADRRKLDEYLTAVRDVEKQIEREIKEASKQRRVDPAATKSVGQIGGLVTAYDGRDHTARLRLMLDIAVLGFWTDATRVATFMFAHERNDMNYSFIDGVNTTHHEASHHTSSPEKLAMYRKICLWQADQISYLLNRMSTIKEGGSTLLDNSVVFWAGALNDGGTHQSTNLPIMLAGRGGGQLKPGRLISQPMKSPLSNLYVSLLRCLGIEVDAFADSTGDIPGLLT